MIREMKYKPFVLVRKYMKRKRRIPLVLKLLTFAFGIYAAFTLVSLQVQINDRKNEIASLNQEINEKTEANTELSQFLEDGADDQYIAQTARDKLGYVSPGERVFIDTSSK